MDASSQRHPFLSAATIAGKGLPPAWQVPLFPQSQPFHWVSACKFRVLEMPASAVTAFDAAKFQGVRVAIWIVRNVAVPSWAAWLNPTAIIWVGGACGNLCAIFQRNWGDARMGHGEPDRTFILVCGFMNGELNSPCKLADSFNKSLALEILLISGCMALTRGQQQTREDQ